MKIEIYRRAATTGMHGKILVGDIKFGVTTQADPAHDFEAPQPIVYKDDIKLKSYGGRRKNVNYYDLTEAIGAAAAVSNLSGAHTDTPGHIGPATRT